MPLLPVLLMLAQTAPAAPPATPTGRPPALEQAPEVTLCAATPTRLPITMVRDYPFLEASVNGVPGKLMLDTGQEPSFEVNDHRVPLPSITVIGRGAYGSGQTFDVHLQAKIDTVTVAGHRFDGVAKVLSHDSTQLEGITPDFLGWIGYDAWRGCALKLDYRSHVATFTPAAAELLKGETIVATLDFTTPKLPNHPIVAATIGGVPFEIAFDTGQYAGFFPDAATKARLLASGAIRAVPGKADTVDVPALRFAGGFEVAIPAVEVIDGGFPPIEPMGLHGPNIMSAGYGLLNQYNTVWDWTNHKLYLLRR